MSAKRQTDLKISADTKNGFWKLPPDVRQVAGFKNDATWYYNFVVVTMGLYKVVLIEEKINKWAARHMSTKRQTDLKISAATIMGT